MCDKKMLRFKLFFLCALFFIGTASTEHIPKTQVDLLVQELEDQSWTEHEGKCIEDILLILNNVKNHTLWAVWIWNSMQHPLGTLYGSKFSLGNYDQCMKTPPVDGKPVVSTQYCVANLRLTDNEAIDGERNMNVYGISDEYLKYKNKGGRIMNDIVWGTCMPASCSRGSVAKIFRVLYSLNPLAATNPAISIADCQIAGAEVVYSTRFFLFFAVMACIIMAAVLSTIYLQYTNEDTRLTRLAYSFSLKRNWSSFARTSGDEIPVISFTRSLQILVTTCVHSFIFAIMGAMSNGLDFDALMTEQAEFMMHIDLPALESFFAISGLLLMKKLMEEKKDPTISLIQRYIRLLGSYVFLVTFTITVSQYIGDGPIWNTTTVKELEICEKNWIWGVLMLSNYVDSKNICQLVTWYIPCDYQLAVIGTVLYGIWKLNPRIGKITAIVATILALVMPGVVTYWNKLPAVIAYDIERLISVRPNPLYTQVYMKSHHRLGPYIIGMATGYILTVFRPAKYRGVISREWTYVGFVLAWLLGLRVWMACPAWCASGLGSVSTSIYAAFNRNIWALSICMCFLITEYGTIPSLIKSIIAWPGFLVFSRLGYGIYITHSLVLQRNINSLRNPAQHDMFTAITYGIGVLAVSSAFAILLWLFVEAPFSNVMNLVLDPKKKPTPADVEKRKELKGNIQTELKSEKLL